MLAIGTGGVPIYTPGNGAPDMLLGRPIMYTEHAKTLGTVGDIIHNAHAILMNTTKHCFLGGGDRANLAKIVEMAAAVSGGKDRLKERPIFSINVCPTSPLRLTLEYCRVAIDTIRTGVPLNIISMAMSGGSAPITLAGTLVVHNAEVLGTVALSQLVRKGTPVIYGSSTTSMDLRMGTASVGCPELGMISAAVAGIAQYYQLPSWVAGG